MKLKAFLFDLDGVIINTENGWKQLGQQFLKDMYGESIYLVIKDQLMGISLKDEYQLAVNHGFKLSQSEHFQRYTEKAKEIFALGEITNGLVDLIDLLSSKGIKIAIVSSSPLNWIEMALTKVPNRDKFQLILSLNDRPDLAGKPAPDGYLEAMKQLNSTAAETMILEDSNRGLEAAMKSGAFTICMKEHLPADYISGEANIYVKKLVDLTRLISLI